MDKYAYPFFAKYDAIAKEIAENKDADEKRASCQETLEKTREELKTATKKREKSDKFIKEQVDRIELV